MTVLFEPRDLSRMPVTIQCWAYTDFTRGGQKILDRPREIKPGFDAVRDARILVWLECPDCGKQIQRLIKLTWRIMRCKNCQHKRAWNRWLSQGENRAIYNKRRREKRKTQNEGKGQEQDQLTVYYKLILDPTDTLGGMIFDDQAMVLNLQDKVFDPGTVFMSNGMKFKVTGNYKLSYQSKNTWLNKNDRPL